MKSKSFVWIFVFLFLISLLTNEVNAYSLRLYDNTSSNQISTYFSNSPETAFSYGTNSYDSGTGSQVNYLLMRKTNSSDIKIGAMFNLTYTAGSNHADIRFCIGDGAIIGDVNYKRLNNGICVILWGNQIEQSTNGVQTTWAPGGTILSSGQTRNIKIFIENQTFFYYLNGAQNLALPFNSSFNYTANSSTTYMIRTRSYDGSYWDKAVVFNVYDVLPSPSTGISFVSPTPASDSFVSSLPVNLSIVGNVTNASRTIYIYNSNGLYNQTTNISYVNFSSLPADIYYFNASVNFTNNTKAWTETRLVYVNVGFFNFSVHNEITGAGINNFTVSFSNINTSVIDIVTTTNGSIRFMYDLNNLYSNVLTLNEGVFEPYSFNFTYSNTSNVLNLSLFPTNAGSAFLIYEGNNSNFNCSGSGVFNLTSCKLYLGDSNVLVFDFKLNKTFNYSFDLNAQTKFRLELVYPSGDIITRYYDISVVSNKSNIRLCANPINITHYEMIIYSASQRGVSLVNPFSDCIVGADYTRFAYQDAFILRTLTIDMPYFLYLVSGGTQTFLVGIDGSVESFINVDTLEFRSQAFDVVLVSDSLTVYNNKSINTSVIKYLNLDLDNSYANISIFNSSGASIFSSGALFNPNNFTVLFDYNLINTSISSLFEIRFCYTETDGDSDCDSYYLDTSSGFSGSGVSSPLAMMIAIVMVILGFTLTQSKLAFSWFGLICLFVALVILAFSPMTWYTKAFMGLIVIYIVFIAFVMPSKAKDTILG